ncbi:MAG: T9SS type A sorting domain-containing protein, partial [Bacteroidota bacterium]
ISLEVAASNDTIILRDIGYNTTAGEGITAGQTNLTSVDEIRVIGVDIHPNPCKNVLSVNWPATKSIGNYSIYDAMGKLMLHGAITRHIDVSRLVPGTYLLTITEGQNFGRKKFTKY